MPKTLECVWRVVNSSVIELTDEQWEAIQNDGLSYYYASDDAAHFIDCLLYTSPSPRDS